jgi:hypothetical protein
MSFMPLIAGVRGLFRDLNSMVEEHGMVLDSEAHARDQATASLATGDAVSISGLMLLGGARQCIRSRQPDA